MIQLFVFGTIFDWFNIFGRNLESLECVATLKGHSSRVNCVRILNSGENFVLSGGMDSSIRIWKMDGTGIAFDNGAHTARVNDIALLGPLSFASVSDDQKAKIWDLEKMICINGEENEFYVLFMTIEYKQSDSIYSCATYGGLLMTGSVDKHIRLWYMPFFCAL